MCRTDALRPVRLPIEARLEGRLVRRYKRFLADVLLPDGREITVHCPNPGRMLGTQEPGAAVRCSTHDNPKRKLRHTLEMIRVGDVWVGLHAARANDVAFAALTADAYPPFSAYRKREREVASPDGSRFDFRLSDPDSEPDVAPACAAQPASEAVTCWVEIKSVTLCEDRRGRFPDAVTERGRRHLDHLAARVRDGDRAALLYIAQRSDADSVAPADDIDPAYGAALRRAVAAGVEVHAWSVEVTPEALLLSRVLPVLL